MQIDGESERARELLLGVIDAIKSGSLALAAARLQEVNATADTARVCMILQVLIFIGSGRSLEALHHVNAADANDYPELRALCLFVLGDPSWEGLANSMRDSDNRYVRAAMQVLLCRGQTPDGDVD